MTTRTAVQIIGLRKSFGGQVVLDGVGLTVAEGAVFALLGPNGAGKTTMVHILATLIAADAGKAIVAGCDVATDPRGVRAAIGVTGQFSAVDDLLTGAENLRLMADLLHLGRDAGKRRAREMLDRFDLTEAAGKQASTYSGGMRRRLDLAMTLMGSPRLIFLDEPTTGLDPRGRHAMWDAVRELTRDGITVFLTTQYLDEADQLAGQIAVLDRGRIVAEGTPAHLKRRIPGGHVLVRFTDLPGLEAAARVIPAAARDDDNLTLQVPGDGNVKLLRHLLAQLDDAGVDVADLTVHTPDLDDVFFAVTGHAAVPGDEQQEALAR